MGYRYHNITSTTLTRYIYLEATRRRSSQYCYLLCSLFGKALSSYTDEVYATHILYDREYIAMSFYGDKVGDLINKWRRETNARIYLYSKEQRRKYV